MYCTDCKFSTIFATLFTNKNKRRMKTMMHKIIYFILLICFPSIVLSQTQTSISAGERLELEKKFQALKTYYIDDDGTVVYRYSDNASEEEAQQPAQKAPSRVKVKVQVDEEGSYVVTTEQPDYTISENDSKLHSIPENIQLKDDLEKKEIEKEHQKLKSSRVQKETSARKASRRESSYKSLEEAAMDLDDLINEYKRMQNQAQNKRGNSLSKKLSGGVDSSIRRDYSKEFADDDDGVEEDHSYGSEPTYYINGVQVEAEEYKKLKPEDIRHKERRASKANPNGEWWVQTK